MAAAPAGASAFDTNPASRVLAAPSTRRAAREMGVDLAGVTGTGPHGRVMREDLDRGQLVCQPTTAQQRPARRERPGAIDDRVHLVERLDAIASVRRSCERRLDHRSVDSEGPPVQVVGVRVDESPAIRIPVDVPHDDRDVAIAPRHPSNGVEPLR